MTPTIDILYLAHGRPEFTAISFLSLLRNTQWKHYRVDQAIIKALYIYTDGDEDNAELIRGILGEDCSINTAVYNGPVAVLNHCLSLPSADYVCKIDNDTMVPPEWLESCLHVLETYQVDLLGIEAWAPDFTVFPYIPYIPPHSGSALRHAVRPTTHIGGIGFYRRSAFATSTPNPAGRFGLAEWQWAQSGLKIGFIDPPLSVFLLDHVPFPPFSELNAQYDAAGVQRRVWGEYPEACSHLWDWWKELEDDITHV